MLLVAEAVLAVVLFRVGRWTWMLATVNAVLTVAFAATLIALIARGELFNTEFFSATSGLDAGAVAEVIGIVVGCVIAATALWKSVDGFRKARGTR